MLLRAAIVFLLVLNIGIAAWWISGGDSAPGPAAAAPAQANVPGLRLVSEIPAPKPVSSAGPVAILSRSRFCSAKTMTSAIGSSLHRDIT